MSSLDVILAGYNASINNEEKLNHPLFKKGYEIASTKRTSARIGKNAPPATGPAADEPASDEFKEGAMEKVKGLIQVQREQEANDALKIEGIQGELFPEEKKPKESPEDRANRKRGEQEFGRDGKQRPEDIWPNYPNMLKINPDAIKGILQLIPILTGVDLQMAGGPMLPGEKGPTPGGLGNMNKDALEQWIKQNNMSDGAANKIRQKWGRLHGGIDLPLAHNYRPGPTGGSLYNTLMIRANELMNEGEKDKALELLKISPELYRLEKV